MPAGDLAGGTRRALSEELVVSGAGKTPLTLTVADLRAFPPEQLAELAQPRHEGEKDAPSSVRGVRLTAILQRAALADVERNDWKHTVVVATATDGYSVAFSWPELFDTEVGDAVLVVFERDGQPLGDRDGRIALVSGKDRRPGPRNVHWLSRLAVRLLKD